MQLVGGLIDTLNYQIILLILLIETGLRTSLHELFIYNPSASRKEIIAFRKMKQFIKYNKSRKVLKFLKKRFKPSKSLKDQSLTIN